jgi:hypothetical protein
MTERETQARLKKLSAYHQQIHASLKTRMQNAATLAITHHLSIEKTLELLNDLQSKSLVLYNGRDDGRNCDWRTHWLTSQKSAEPW